VILVGTDDGFAAVGVDIARRPTGHRMDAAAATAAGIWAISDGQHLWHHPVGGDGEIVARLDGPRANCVAASDDMVLVGASAARLFRFDGDGLVEIESFANAPGRHTWGTPWGGPPDVRSVTVGPDGVVYVNVHVGGVLVSSDLGEWAATMDISADVHQVVADQHRAGTAYAAAAVGLGITHDWGATWSFETSGLHATYCRAVAVSNDFLLVSAAVGSSGSRAAVYRRSLEEGAPLLRCDDGLGEWFGDNVDTFCIAASGNEAVIAAPDGTVYRSPDGGLSWIAAATGLPGVRCALYVSEKS
jgi:hypothetical protein